MKLVAVNAGYQHVPIYGGIYNQGQVIRLTDDQYVGLPSVILTQIHIVSSAPTGTVLAPPGEAISRVPSDSFTAGLISSMLSKEQVPVYLTWDGSDYQPQSFKGVGTRIKTFIGPVDPSSVGGVIVNNYDQWIRSN